MIRLSLARGHPRRPEALAATGNVEREGYHRHPRACGSEMAPADVCRAWEPGLTIGRFRRPGLKDCASRQDVKSRRLQLVTVEAE